MQQKPDPSLLNLIASEETRKVFCSWVLILSYSVEGSCSVRCLQGTESIIFEVIQKRYKHKEDIEEETLKTGEKDDKNV